MRDARAHPGVGAEEGVHAVLVAGEDHDQVVALVLHHLQQDLDRFLPVVALVLGPVEVVRLIDEQHAPHCALQYLASLRRGMTDVLAHEVIARHGHEVPFAHVPEAIEDLRHAQRHGGLACAGVAGEAHVQARRLGLEPEIHAQPVDHEQRRDVADARLDGREPHEIAIELVDHRIRLALSEHLAHGVRTVSGRDAGRRGARRGG